MFNDVTIPLSISTANLQNIPRVIGRESDEYTTQYSFPED